MSDVNEGAVEVAFWIRDNDRMLISAAAMEQISNKIDAAHAAGVAAEQARWVAALEARDGELDSGFIERFIAQVRQ